MTVAPVTPNSFRQSPPLVGIEDQPIGTPAEWALDGDLPSIQDIPFNLDVNDDSGLWEEVLGQIDIDMDRDWIEHTLRR